MSAYMSVSYLEPQEQREVEAFIKSAIPPKEIVRPDYGLIEANYWNRLRTILGKNRAQITYDNLVIANLVLVEEDRAAAREHARFLQVLADVEAALTNIPDFNRGDEHNVKAAEAFFNQNPTATAQDFINDINLHPDHYHWYSGPRKPDLVAILRKDASPAMRQVLVQTYGQAAVDAAWNTIAQRFGKGLNDAANQLRREGLKKADEAAAEAKTAQEKRESDPEKIAEARSRVESLISGFRVSNNHAENSRGKEYLRSLENNFIKPGDTEPNWFRYEESVRAYIDAQVRTSVR